MLKLLPSPKMHGLARLRFNADPTKCYQRHIRELWDEREQKPHLESLDGARVVRISNEEAAGVILKYEWLRTMASGTKVCYGLKLNGELLGAACFSIMGGPIRNICGPKYKPKAVCLARGACVPHAPKNAGSFQTRWACKQAFEDFGWQIFFAYSDSDAGEVGTIYQACGWHYVGEGPGRPSGSFHVDFKSPNGARLITSYALNHDTDRTIFRDLGWSESKGDPRQYLLYRGWKQINRYGKKKWLWFEGSPEERAHLKSLCRYPILPYPKRETSTEAAPQPSNRAENEAFLCGL
jgi:hypothetical protein